MTNSTTAKRSLPSSSSTPNAKRPRSSNASSSSQHPDEDEDMGEEDEVVPLDETALERKARKDARTIRNRESAQRSRNQRKAHLAWLEVRVVELEAENSRLRGGAKDEVATPKSQALHTEPSPYSSDLDLSFSSSIFPSLSGGINLAVVAPPPPGVADTKPFIPEQTPPPSAVNQLRAENAALRARLNLLEDLVKQVAAVSNLGAVAAAPIEPLEPSAVQESLDWDSIFNPTTIDLTQPPQSSTDIFLAPEPIRQISPTLYSLPNPLPLAPIDTTQQSSPTPLACHPAAVATPSVQTEWSLQRARTDSGLILGISTVARAAVTEKRLDGVARVLVALAKIRGWIPSSTSQTPSLAMWRAGRAKTGLRTGRRRMGGLAQRRGGMRG